MSKWYASNRDAWEGDPQYGESVAWWRFWWLCNLHHQFCQFKIAAVRKTEEHEKKDEKDIRRFTKWLYFDGKPRAGVKCGPFERILYASSIHRELLPNEIVFELDQPSYSRNAIIARDFIRQVLEPKKIPCYIFFSGNKSIHIHVFIEPRISLPKSLGERLVTSGFKLKFLTQTLYQNLMSSYGQMGFDSGLMSSSSHMVRTVGSVHVITDLFKTYLGETSEDIPAIRPCFEYSKGMYPAFSSEAKARFRNLRTWKPPTKQLMRFLEKEASCEAAPIGEQMCLYRFGSFVKRKKRWDS